MSDFNKFSVNFSYMSEDDELEFETLCEEEDFDEDAWWEDHTFTRILDISFSEDEFDAFHQSEIFDEIENEYGILDCSGSDDEIGFASDEISPEDAPIVWEKLVEALKTFIR